MQPTVQAIFEQMLKGFSGVICNLSSKPRQMRYSISAKACDKLYTKIMIQPWEC